MTQSTENPYSFETGVYRPPSEGGSHSLLIRVSRNCPWNHCTFCGMYKSEKFSLRSVEDIKGDINAMAALCFELREISRRQADAGVVNREAAIELVRLHPELNYHEGFPMLYHWLLSGGKTAFLQDADSLIMKTDHLVEILRHLRTVFPSLERITSYSRSKTLMKKSVEELKAIHQAGLDRVHVGLESGDDTVLTMVRKGATGEVHIQGGRKAKEAGFQLSEYWMPGLGGKGLWENHAKNTARILSAIDPHYIRSRPLHAWVGTPLYDELTGNRFEMQSAAEHLYELKITMAELNVTSRVCFDHDGNYWKNRRGGRLLSLSYEGYKFPEEKQIVIDLIEEGLTVNTDRPSFLRM